MSYFIRAAIYSTRTDSPQKQEEITASLNAEISDAEAKHLEERRTGSHFTLPLPLLDIIKIVNDDNDSDSKKAYSKLTIDRIAMIEIRDRVTDARLIRFFVEGARRGETSPANHWRPLSVADEENVTVADWKRNDGRGVFVMSENVGEVEAAYEGISSKAELLTPKDKVVRLVGDRFCIFNPAQEVPAKRVWPPYTLQLG